MKAEDLKKLSAPFPDEEIDWKVQRCGLRGNDPWAVVVPYVDARAIMKRLDDVAGPENWQTKLLPTANGMLCELSLRINGEWVAKMDGSDETDYEPFKGGISKALVRAAVHWGIGRDLYNLPDTFAKFVEKSTPGARWAKIDGKEFWWVPNIPAAARARPEGGTTARPAAPAGKAGAAPKPATGQAAAQRTAQQTAGGARSGATAPGPASRSAATPAKAIDATVPFGHNQGKRLSELSEQELAGLADFYSRVSEPRGKAKTFKDEFDQYMAARQKAHRSA
jgi:hypothetical protein